MSKCGNGIIDDGEQCDDGNDEDNDCCSSTCILMAAGFICRNAIDTCDKVDVCDGVQSFCGNNELLDSSKVCGFDDIHSCSLTCSGLSTACPKVCSSSTPMRPITAAPNQTPISEPTLPISTNTPMSNSPTKMPASNSCGLFGAGVFCPLTFRGIIGRFIRRILGLED